MSIKLGAGTYGTVYLKKNLAVKVYNEKSENGVRCDVIREISVLQALAHPNIVEFIKIQFESDKKTPSLVTRFAAGGSLETLRFNTLRMGYRLDMRSYANIILGLFDGLRYLHSLGIVHRDIKPQNLLFCTEDETVKIADFGSASLHRSTTELPGDWHSDWVTTLPYRAPEALMGLNKILGPEMDVWSAGVVVFEILTGQNFIAHSHETNEEALENMLYMLGTPTPDNSGMPSYFAQKGTKKLPIQTVYPPSFSFDIVEYYATGRPQRWGFGYKTLIRILKTTVRLEPSSRLTADEVYNILLANTIVVNDPMEMSDRQTSYENAAENVMESLSRRCEEVKGDMIDLRKAIGFWIFDSNIMSRNIHTRRRFHVAAAIWDQLMSIPGCIPSIENSDGMAALMVAIHNISLKVCDTTQYDDYTDLYHQHRKHIIRSVGRWSGLLDETVTSEAANRMELQVLNRIEWNCWRILPIDLEGGPEYGSVVCKGYVFRYLVDVAIAIGSNIHIGRNVRRVLDAAAWLEGVISLQCSFKMHLDEDVKIIVVGIIKTLLDHRTRSPIFNFYSKSMFGEASLDVTGCDLCSVLAHITQK